MRRIALSLFLFALAGCAAPVTVQDPKTGESVTCSTPASKWNPWSQSGACVAERIAEGWVIAR
jgi:uncharacterized protein YceK